jgi:hypothetical protein
MTYLPYCMAGIIIIGAVLIGWALSHAHDSFQTWR